jgi:hypothetical protein
MMDAIRGALRGLLVFVASCLFLVLWSYLARLASSVLGGADESRLFSGFFGAIVPIVIIGACAIIVGALHRYIPRKDHWIVNSAPADHAERGEEEDSRKSAGLWRPELAGSAGHRAGVEETLAWDRGDSRWGARSR